MTLVIAAVLKRVRRQRIRVTRGFSVSYNFQQ
jgi:hypothetical protein